MTIKLNKYREELQEYSRDEFEGAIKLNISKIWELVYHAI